MILKAQRYIRNLQMNTPVLTDTYEFNSDSQIVEWYADEGNLQLWHYSITYFPDGAISSIKAFLGSTIDNDESEIPKYTVTHSYSSDQMLESSDIVSNEGLYHYIIHYDADLHVTFIEKQ